MKAVRPLVLVHGFGIGHPSMYFWRRKLGKTYYVDKGVLRAYKDLPVCEPWQRNSVVTISYQNLTNFNTVNHYAAALPNALDFILTQTNSNELDIIAHSNGGLISRTTIQNGYDRIANLIMLATPNQGVSYAKISDVKKLDRFARNKKGYYFAKVLKRLGMLAFLFFPDGRDLCRGSKLIDKLNNYDISHDKTNYVTVAGIAFGGSDLIIEASSVYLDGATNLKEHENHASLLRPGKRLMKIVEDTLLKDST